MSDTATSNIHNVNNNIITEGKSIRAVLFEKYVGMSELLLPATVEGKYTFPFASELFSIIADNKKWKAQISNGYFLISGNASGNSFSKTNEIFLQNNSLYTAQIGNKIYSLHTEDYSDSSRSFQPLYIAPNIDIIIGREHICDIQYDNHLVSREHATLRNNGNKFIITDKNSRNGVYVNGKQIQSAELKLGDSVYIMGLCIIIGAGYISINNMDKCKITTQRVTQLTNNIRLSYLPPSRNENQYYDRKPRKKYQIDQKTIEIDLPPSPLSSTKMPLFLRMGNSALMGGQALLTGNYFSAVSSLLFPALTQGFTEKDRKEYEAKRIEFYREYLKNKEMEIASEIQLEEAFLNYLFPGFYETLGFIKNQTRLWECRHIDDDFLTVRLGIGSLPMVAEKKFPIKKFEMEPDFLQEEMYALAEKPALLNNVPITLSLSESWIFGIVGTQNKSLQMVIQMIAYIAITHAYDDVKMVILAPEALKNELSFAKYLRHFWDNERTIRFIATSSSDVQVISKYFRDKNIIDTAKNSNYNTEKKNNPAYIVFALDKNLFEQSEFFKEVLTKDKYNGISVITAFEHAPKECMKLLDLRVNNILMDLNDPNAKDIALSIDNIDMAYLKKGMNNLSQINLLLENEKSYSLPSMMTFLEMYNVGKVEHLNPLARWESNNPVKSLAVPIGIGTDGKLFTLDLHEKHQGPHGLVAGMTGSGKSEFIITYILSLAVNFSPDEVAFVLIDYKGGGLADAFVDPKRGIHLPHVVATITNLDGAAIQRSLISIQSELSRRQELFKRAKSETGEGTMDIYDYQRLYRNKQVSEPMPHLFIISDEFAELKKQEPEFMDALISAARIGRSLGVHLILATQKPGGVVNDQIWSNTKFRACLKVQDRSDSMEMLKRPEAAELKHTGRFYLQVGYNEFFALGQSAWCGAGYIPQEKIIKEKDVSVDFIDNSGQVILKAKEKKVRIQAKSKQIVAIVQYLSDLAKRENIIPKSLWCNPLPAKIDLKKLAAEYPNTDESGISSLIGLVDDPEHQRQFPLSLNMSSFHHMALCGLAGSGKSTFFKTMLYSLVMNYTPEDINYYILDLSGGVLSVLKGMPHCGAYLTKENESDFDRLLLMINEIVEDRKNLFAESDVYSFDDYLKIKKLPLILVILDGWTNINEFAKGQHYSLHISKNMRDAANYGVRFIFSVNHLNEFSAKVNQEFDYKIALQAKDKFDYNDILNLRNANLPPELSGRGVCAHEGKALEYQVAVPNSDLDGQNQTLTMKKELDARAEELSACQPARRLPVMDDQLEYSVFCNSFKKDRIPLGFHMQNMKEVAIPLQQLFTMGLYFGNPLGVKPIIFNILSAFRRENAEVIVVRKNSGTIFDRDTENEIRSMYNDRFFIIDTNSDNLSKLFDLIVSENIPNYRVPPRNEYCEMHGIPDSDKGRTVKAAKYIRSKTTPLVVLFESFADLVAADKENYYSEVFGKLKGFNIYFISCFYPEDDVLSSNTIFRSFNKEDFSLLFGGQFQKQWLTPLATEYRKMEKINPNYNRFIMKYHNDYYRMIMPCGELKSADKDPDEEDII